MKLKCSYFLLKSNLNLGCPVMILTFRGGMSRAINRLHFSAVFWPSLRVLIWINVFFVPGIINLRGSLCVNTRLTTILRTTWKRDETKDTQNKTSHGGNSSNKANFHVDGKFTVFEAVFDCCYHLLALDRSSIFMF